MVDVDLSNRADGGDAAFVLDAFLPSEIALKTLGIPTMFPQTLKHFYDAVNSSWDVEWVRQIIRSCGITLLSMMSVSEICVSKICRASLVTRC
jgi:hypothetical protein